MADKHLKSPSIIKREHDVDAAARRVVIKSALGRSVAYEDTSFVTGESPAIHDINTDLGRNGISGYIANDGAGNFTVQASDDGSNYGGVHVIKNGEILDLNGLSIDKIKITWVSNSSYRIFVV